MNNQAKRDVFLLEFGIRCPLRISDMLSLRVQDIRGISEITVSELKTGKVNRLPVNNQLAQLITEYTNGMLDTDWVFPSRKGDKPITRQQAHRILALASDYCGLAKQGLVVGCHTLRKTFGYKFYNLDPTRNLTKLQILLNHHMPSTTLRYIGIEAEDIAEQVEGVTF